MTNLDDGLILIGPGSEWFWTAFQGVVVAVTLWALFRQLRLQTAQKMRDEVATLRIEYFSERMMRHQDETFAKGFEWFVKGMVRTEPTLATGLDLPRSRYAQGVVRLEELISVETELRR